MKDLCTRHAATLRRIDPATLGEQDRLTYEILAHRLQSCLDGFRFDWYLLPVDHVGQRWPSRFPIIGAGRGSHPFKTPQNYEDFLGRIDGFVAWMDTAIANMRVGVGARLHAAAPRHGEARPAARRADRGRSEGEPLLRAHPQRPGRRSTRPPARRWRRSTRRRSATRSSRPTGACAPSCRRSTCRQCRTSYGWSDLPGGREGYRLAVRWSTTTELTPDEIFEIGLAEVKRITAEIDALRAEIDAAGEPEPMRFRSLDSLLAGYARLQTTVDAAMPRLFGRFPKTAVEVRPVEPFRERTLPSSYEAGAPDGSRPGVFYLNAGDVRRGGTAPVFRNLYLHEAVPGHHFQIALQRENPALPGFRRFAWYTAFGEGWALYAESLGSELGAYTSRRDRLGMLGGELFRARRLVVDVGLHAKGWSRDQALTYLGGRSPNTELEVDRYMVWPGQALGYKIGQLRILGLRRKAEAALGTRLRRARVPRRAAARRRDAARRAGAEDGPLARRAPARLSQPPLAAGRSRLLQPRLFLKVPHRDPADGHRVGMRDRRGSGTRTARRGRRSAW